MNSPSTRPLPRRVSSLGGGRVVPALALFLALAITGCPSGYVQTESGATVAASTVYAQDILGDALKIVQDVHNAAVMAHDAKAGQELADVHAARRAKLLASAAGLRSGWDGLSAWKAGTEGGGLGAVAGKLHDALPGLLVVAVELKVVPQGTADAISAFFGLAVQGRTPAPLKKQVVVSVLIPGQEIDWRAVVQPVHRGRLREFDRDGRYFDGCNWHTALPFGGEGVTSMGCGYSTQLVTVPLTYTLEWPLAQPAFDPPSLHGEPATTTLEWRPR